ncbi:oligopeptide ABC transporter ATP-binding protein [Spiroplasma sabaudiense Ar-1343]|uniref:Oligopeptide ABC transporter ATP-binding protein n=1 Tax=Spiroplasma sabaudiense Ar-1343 TaxID=1276257 RepID=W6AKF0_9MOLU|nr:oligopeptide ABC transporter ATP-binding protein OppD [Spiroplasma sabaudiense]AHI54184.1 oligopeptide ABC transporter ATP-binding protein [Spiroplasma sabaudiense Ar-1343]
MEKIISIKDLIVKFRVRSRTLTAIRNVSFDIYDGETVAIVGESGSGKSVMTKTLTNMLEENGWVSNGSITYFPSARSVESGNAYFTEETDLLDFHKKLLEKSTRKGIIRQNKKTIKEKSTLIEKINALDPKVVEEKLRVLNESLQNNKTKYEFAKSNRGISKAIPIIEAIELYEDILKTAVDAKYKTSKLENLSSQIETAQIEIEKFRVPSLIQRLKLSKNIKIIKKYSQNPELVEAKDFETINKYFTNKSHLSEFEAQLQVINNQMVEKLPINQKTLNNLLIDWKCIYQPSFLTQKKANKEITKLRGATIATIFQDPMTSLNPLLPVGFQITEVLKKHHNMSRHEAKEEAIALLGKVGIPNPEKRYKDIPGRYSGGMRQRVVIAIALACRPKILICDEPTTALDVTIQSQILNLIKDLQKEYGFTTIFITHDLGVVANIADRVAVMYAGQIIEHGSVDDIFFNPQHPYTWSLLSSLPQLGVKGEELFSIPGTPPSLFSNIKGDAFAPRNQYAMKVDYLYEPPMFKVSETHYAKTWLLDPRSPKVKRPKQLDILSQAVSDAKVGD